MAARDVEHARAARADPDLREAALVGLGIHARMMQLEELPFEIDRPVALPEQADHFQRLLETADRLREVEAIGQRVLLLAAAEAEDERPRER